MCEFTFTLTSTLDHSLEHPLSSFELAGVGPYLFPLSLLTRHSSRTSYHPAAAPGGVAPLALNLDIVDADHPMHAAAFAPSDPHPALVTSLPLSLPLNIPSTDLSAASRPVTEQRQTFLLGTCLLKQHRAGTSPRSTMEPSRQHCHVRSTMTLIICRNRKTSSRWSRYIDIPWQRSPPTQPRRRTICPTISCRSLSVSCSSAYVYFEPPKGILWMGIEALIKVWPSGYCLRRKPLGMNIDGIFRSRSWG